MTSQDFVNSATEAQMKLHAAVRRGEWPDPGPDLHTRPTPIWRYVTLACLVAFAGWILMGMAARAAERGPRVWQMWAAGSRLTCVRIDQKKGQ